LPKGGIPLFDKEGRGEISEEDVWSILGPLVIFECMIKCPRKGALGLPAITAGYPKRDGQSIYKHNFILRDDEGN
jgi:hypothetical protein